MRFARSADPTQPTLVMGIVNVTPDSFSDGGRFATTDRAVAHGLLLVEQGAHIVDVGGESTRPGADPIDPVDELRPRAAGGDRTGGAGCHRQHRHPPCRDSNEGCRRGRGDHQRRHRVDRSGHACRGRRDWRGRGDQPHAHRRSAHDAGPRSLRRRRRRGPRVPGPAHRRLSPCRHRRDHHRPRHRVREDHARTTSPCWHTSIDLPTSTNRSSWVPRANGSSANSVAASAPISGCLAASPQRWPPWRTAQRWSACTTWPSTCRPSASGTQSTAYEQTAAAQVRILGLQALHHSAARHADDSLGQAEMQIAHRGRVVRRERGERARAQHDVDRIVPAAPIGLHARGGQVSSAGAPDRSQVVWLRSADTRSDRWPSRPGADRRCGLPGEHCGPCAPPRPASQRWCDTADRRRRGSAWRAVPGPTAAGRSARPGRRRSTGPGGVRPRCGAVRSRPPVRRWSVDGRRRRSSGGWSLATGPTWRGLGRVHRRRPRRP